MEKKTLIDKLILTFKEETEKLKEKFGECEYTTEVYFRNNNPEKGLHSVDACFEFEKYILKFEYKVNVSMLMPKSLVEMRFMLKTGKLPVEYSIYDILDIIKPDDFKCYTLPLINSKKQMVSAIRYLAKTFLRYKNRIEKVVDDANKVQELEKNIDDKIFMLLNERVFKSRDVGYLTRILELYYVVDTARFTSKNYLNVLKGKYKKAIKQYSREENKLTNYEKRLLQYIKENEVKDILPENLKTLENAKKVQGSFKELLSMYISWIVVTPFWAAIYLLVYAISYIAFNKGTIYTTYSNIPYIILFGFITSIVSSYFLRKKIYKIFFRKNQKEMLAFDELENTKATNKFMTKFLQFVIATSLVLTVLFANTNLQFREDGIVSNLDFFSIKGEFIEYTQIDKLYKTEYTVDVLGEKMDATTYTISLKNGEKIDLSYELTTEEIEEKILPILNTHNVVLESIKK